MPALPETFNVRANAQFYGQMICAFMDSIGVQEGVADFDTLQGRLGLTEEEVNVGINWCMERGIISFDPQGHYID